jgi:hypothetical protein
VEPDGGFKSEFYPESNRDYFSKLWDEQITFDIDGQGRTIGLTHHENGSTQRAKRID